MLGAAHVLAMDSKNLLDVIDCIRKRYPLVLDNLPNAEEVLNEPKLEMVGSHIYNNSEDIPNLPTPVSCTFVSFPKVETVISGSTQISDS